MDISIIIVSWNVRELLKKCLESVFAHATPRIKACPALDAGYGAGSAPPPPDSAGGQRGGDRLCFEIIVVDNASSDGTVSMLKQNFSQIKLIASDKNLGFARANNLGIKEAKGDYILLLNPDTEFITPSHSELGSESLILKQVQSLPRTRFGDDDRNTLEKVAAKMQNDPALGVLGCQLLNSDKTVQPSVRRFPTIGSQLAILTKLHHLFPSLLDNYLARDFDYSREQETDQVMGAFFCARRELFDKIGLLDEGYFIWFEEVDFCRRAKRAGWKVVYWPGTRVVHHGGQSFKQQMTLKKQWWFFKSAARYFLKTV